MTLVRSIVLALAVLAPVSAGVAIAEEAPKAEKAEAKKEKAEKKADKKADKAEKKAEKTEKAK